MARYKLIEVEDRGEYVVARFKTKVSHELAIPKGEDIDEHINRYLEEYERVYPETRLE